MSDLNLIHAAQVARVHDHGEPRRRAPGVSWNLVADGAIASVSTGVVVTALARPEWVVETDATAVIS